MSPGPGVGAAPNWADLEGEVESLEPAALAGFTAVRLAVSAVRDVPGFANLFVDAPGGSEVVLVPDDVVAGLRIAPGAVLACRVRRHAPGRSFAHRDHVTVVRAP